MLVNNLRFKNSMPIVSLLSFKRSEKPVIADGKPLISLRRDKQREDEVEVDIYDHHLGLLSESESVNK